MKREYVEVATVATACSDDGKNCREQRYPFGWTDENTVSTFQLYHI